MLQAPQVTFNASNRERNGWTRMVGCGWLDVDGLSAENNIDLRTLKYGWIALLEQLIE